MSNANSLEEVALRRRALPAVEEGAGAATLTAVYGAGARCTSERCKFNMVIVF